MARQTGIHTLSGSAADMNYYKSRDGNIARKKATIPKTTLRRGAAFANSRKAGKTFGLASTASRLIRTAFGEMILAGSNRDINNRLLACLRENAERVTTLTQLPWQQLAGFNINQHALFGSICHLSSSVTMPAPGQVIVSFPPFHPKESLKPPRKSGMTHFRLFAGLAQIDCKKKEFKKDIQATQPLSIKQRQATAPELRLAIPPLPHQPLLVAIGIVFCQLVNGEIIDSVNEHHCPVLITTVHYEPPPAPPKTTPRQKKPAAKKKPAAPKTARPKRPPRK